MLFAFNYFKTVNFRLNKQKRVTSNLPGFVLLAMNYFQYLTQLVWNFGELSMKNVI